MDIEWYNKKTKSGTEFACAAAPALKRRNFREGTRERSSISYSLRTR